MKIHEVIFTVIFVAFLVLAACVSDSNDKDAYERGYSDGYSDAEFKYEDEYIRGYDDGHSEGYMEAYRESQANYFPYLIDEAEEYARDRSGCSPMEALDIIGVYHDQDNPLYSDIHITEEEYLQAVDALMEFYNYLDNTDY